MARATRRYVCRECGANFPKWRGFCDACGTADSVEEETVSARPRAFGVVQGGKSRPAEMTDLSVQSMDEPRRSTGMGELDRVLGGGLVQGSAVLIGGDPGIGKSTLLLQAAARLAGAGGNVVYVSGEEATAQVAMRARRLGLDGAAVRVANANALGEIMAALDAGPVPDLLVIDSIQTVFSENLDSAPGTVAQVRACGHDLVQYAKKSGAAVFLVGHVTKDGQIAGPRVLEHMVDTVLYFEGDRSHHFRILRSVKNRFGAADEIGVFEMAEQGLIETPNPSALFLGDRDEPVAGAAIFAGMEGSRPLLVEVQALVAPSPLATPRRAVVGWDSGRLAMILAVLDTRLGLSIGQNEVYLNVAGGLRISEPAADLAVAAALLSSLSGRPLPQATVVFGEIGLSGAVRRVARAEARIREAARLGFEHAILPAGSEGKDLIRTTEIGGLDRLLGLFPLEDG
ncbi:MAG: DNA repair protein RadA [Minwuia sp.]|uniref:DNA repair protein RadA n=1 Tax=Minwuia sp. TaxID=2493630 RepID=UPI003A8C3D78